LAGNSAKHYDIPFLILSSQPWSSKGTLASSLQPNTCYTFILSVLRLYAPCCYHPHCLIIPTSRGVSHSPVPMFYVDYALALKKELSIDCVVWKARDEAEETAKHLLLCL